MEIKYKKKEGSTKLYIPTDVVSGGGQPDWNENDPNAAGYVRNRTHYLIGCNEVVVAEEQEASGRVSTSMGPSRFNLTLSAEPLENAVYTVTYFGEEYQCEYRDGFIGNLIDSGTYVDNGYPFAIDLLNGYIYKYASTKPVVSITMLVKVASPLDDVYIPESIARVADVPYMTKEVLSSGGFSLTLNSASEKFSLLVDDYGNLYTLSSTGALISSAVNVPTKVFKSRNDITSVDLPFVKSINDYAFQWCSNIASVNLPMVETLGASAFIGGGNTVLTTVVLPSVKSIGVAAFSGCTNLATVVIKQSDSVCTAGASAFGNSYGPTLISEGTGYIYVPDALVDSYKAAENWSTYADQIKPLSEYTE